MQTYLHLIDQSGLHIWHAEGKTLVRDIVFAHGDADGFSAWLRKSPKALHTILVDVPDEGFHVESIPRIFGADRRNLIQRKLTQHFFGTPYSAGISLGREKTGRRDERMLFAALTRPDLIEPWLDALSDCEAPVRALLAPPLLTPRLLQGLGNIPARGLIIALSSSGIRQIFFDEGQLRFARLSPPPEGHFDDWGEACLREAQKTCQYLSGQRWIPRNTPLPAYILCGPSSESLMAGMQRAGSPEAHWLELQAVDLDTLQRKLGIQSSAADADSRQLWLQLAHQATPKLQLAPEPDRRFWRIRQMRNAILAAGAASLFVGSLWATHSWLDQQTQRDSITQLQLDIRHEQQRYDQLLASLPALPAALDTLRTLVDTVDQIQATPVQPHELLLHLSQSLDRFPDVDLSKLHWRAQDFTDSSPNSQIKANKALQATTILELDANLPVGANADPRQAIERIRAFAADLRRTLGGTPIAVSILEQPFNVESDKTLRSADSVEGNARPHFRLRLEHSAVTAEDTPK